MNSELIRGIFIEEAKGRFLCTVNIDGMEEPCYVSSSSKLSHFISLNGREVLVTRNTSSKSRTRYTLFAVKTEEGYALLNLVYINKLLFLEFSKPSHMYSSIGKIHPEKKINDTIKVDFFIYGEKDIVVEAKGILAEEDVASFPAMKIVRAESQLLQYEKLLKKGLDVHYYIVLMNAAIKDLKLDMNYKEFMKPFKRCIKKGMKLYIYKVIWNNEFTLIREHWLEKKINQSMI